MAMVGAPLDAEYSLLSPVQLREAIGRLYGDRRSARTRLALELNVHQGTVDLWLAGKSSIPGPAEVAVSLLLELKPKPEVVPPLSSAELREAMSALYDDPLISQRQHRFAKALKVTPATMVKWLSGRRSISGPAEVAVRLLLEKRALDTRGRS